jgi:chromosome segregation protein
MNIKAIISHTETIINELSLQMKFVSKNKLLNKSKLDERIVDEYTLRHLVEKTESQINSLELKFKNIVEEKSYLTDKQLLLTEKLQNINSELYDKKSRYEIFMELKNNFDGYYKPVKSILNEKKKYPNKFRGVRGPIGELMSVIPQYETAIEVALGNSIQSIVTTNELDAQEAIEYLKEKKDGRATFLPISTIKTKQNISNINSILNDKGVVGLAIELITYDEEFKNIFISLLGRIIVVDNMTTAIKINKQSNYSFRIVTLSGEILSTGGSITGGSIASKNSNIFNKNREIEELQTFIRDISVRQNELQAQISELNGKIIDNNNNMDMFNNVKQEYNLKLSSENQRLLQLKKEIEEFINIELTLNVQEKENYEKLNRSQKELDLKQNEFTLAEDTTNKLKIKLEQAQKSILYDKQEKDLSGAELTSIKIDINVVIQKINSTEINISRITKDIELLQQTISTNENNKISMEKQILDKKEQIAINKSSIEYIYQDHVNLISENTKLNDDKLSNLENLKVCESKQKERNSDISNLNNELVRLSMKKEQIESENNKLFSSMWDKYNITHRRALEVETLNLPLGELKSDEKKMSLNIQNLGIVNINAIDEYADVKDRYEFLSSQRNDILNAEEKLVDIIKELTNLMSNQFKEQFEIISVNFTKVFGDMFNGGSARLVLSDNKNILESNIDIEAQPPGKKLVNMSLLSGGERSLTATSLLFAILVMKPSPFCILDEVEAALDDANVNRYATFIKNFAFGTQFIIITHRKGTMESADALYGITMQEKGVSKLVSVKFTEGEGAI